MSADPSLCAGPSFTGRQLAWLAAITVLAAGLRLWCLDAWSVWVDEAHTFRDATGPWEVFQGTNRARYPIPFLVLRWYLEVFEMYPQEAWIRLPYAFVGIVSVPLLALAGAPMVGRRAALLAALFLAVNPWHIYWSQNARHYVFVFWFAVLSALVYWRARQKDSRLLMVAAVVCVLLAGFSHTPGFLLFGVFLVDGAYGPRGLLGRGRTGALLLSLALVVLAVVLVFLAPHLPVVAEFVAAKGRPAPLHFVHTSAFFFRVPLVLAALGGLWFLSQENARNFRFLLCWVCVPTIAVFLAGTTLMKTTARFAFICLPAVLLLASLAAVRVAEIVSKHSGAARAGWLPAVLLPAVLLVDMLAYDYLYYTVQYGDRPRWREATQYVKADAGSGRVLLLTTNRPSMLFYFAPDTWRSGRPVGPYRVEDILDWKIADPGEAEAWLDNQLERAASEGRRVYAVVTQPELEEKDRSRSLEQLLRIRFRQVQSYPAWVGPKDQTVFVYALLP